MTGVSRRTEVVIIGAGPYGLSIAAHLRACGVAFRAFGMPMHNWHHHMPEGMHLKSEGTASNLYEPKGKCTLQHFCAKEGIEYRERGLPVKLETLLAYGRYFQERHVPELEAKRVESVDRFMTGFLVRLDDGEVLTARKVVVAVGITHFQYTPALYAALPSDRVSHSFEHRDLRRFAGRDVTVIGGGASALDLAGLIAAAGAKVRLLVRRPRLVWGTPPGGDRSLWQRIRYPQGKLGVGLRLRLYERPGFCRRLPARVRHHIVRTTLGPLGSWITRDLVEGRVTQSLGCSVRAATACSGGVQLQVVGPDRREFQVETDHVIAATGYRVELDRLTLLSETVRAGVRVVNGAPRLSGAFESSCPGLYFVGLAASASFGPAMRFMVGAEYTARTLARRLE